MCQKQTVYTPYQEEEPGDLDEMAALEAEIAKLEQQKRLLALRQQRDALRAETEQAQASTSHQRNGNPSFSAASYQYHPVPLQPASSSSSSSSSSNNVNNHPTFRATSPLVPPTKKPHDPPQSQEEQPPPYALTCEASTHIMRDENHAFHQQHRLPPARADSCSLPRHLAKPIAIPATSASLGSPFMRAYPPWLTDYGVDRATFLGFLDDLNRCAVASPPVRALGLAAQVVGLVPISTAQIVGGAVQLSASVATFALSRGRTEACLRAANQRLFGPRGLKAEVARLDALAKIAGIPVLDPASGKVDRRAPVLLPLEELGGSLGWTAQQRRLDSLREWIAPLDVAPLPEVKQSDNVLGKIHTMASESQRRKEEKKMRKDREKALEKHRDGSDDQEKERRKLEKDMQKLERKETEVRLTRSSSTGKMRKELEKIERDRARLVKEHDKEMAKIHKEKGKDDKEEKGVRKILWLVIRNLEDAGGLDQGDESGYSIEYDAKDCS